MTFDQAMKTANLVLRIAFFGLMCLGLLIASGFLYAGKIDGAEWTALCSILFSADRIGNAIGSKV